MAVNLILSGRRQLARSIASLLLSFPIVTAAEVATDFQFPIHQNDGIQIWNSGLGISGGWGNGQDYQHEDADHQDGIIFGGSHLGEDWSDNRGVAGMPVYCIADGVVTLFTSSSAYGAVMMVRHDLPEGGYVISLYGHIQSPQQFESTHGWKPTPGISVQKGSLIAQVASSSELEEASNNSNYPYPPHLHFEIRGDQSQTGLTDTQTDNGYGAGTGYFDPTDIATSYASSSTSDWNPLAGFIESRMPLPGNFSSLMAEYRSDGIFTSEEPRSIDTRGEFAYVIATAMRVRSDLELPLPDDTHQFSDLAGHPWEDEVATLVAMGAISTSNSQFRVNDTITRGEAIAIATVCLEYFNGSLPSGGTGRFAYDVADFGNFLFIDNHPFYSTFQKALAAGLTDGLVQQMMSRSSGQSLGNFGMLLPDTSIRRGDTVRLCENLISIANPPLTYPDIAVSYSGIDIANDDSEPTSTKGTHFGSNVMIGTSETRGFEIQNTGNALLTISNFTISDPEFSIVQAPTNLQINGTGVLVIRYTPADAQEDTAVVSFTTNVNDQNPFTFAVFGGGEVDELQPPTNVSASKGTFTDRVRITWNIVSGADRYYVYRASTLNGSYSALSGFSVGNSRDDLLAAAGQTFYYRVRAFAAGEGFSSYSATDSGYMSQPTDSSPPILAINSPADNQSVSTNQLSVSGTATDNVGVTSVEVKTNSNSWIPATLAGTSWTATVLLTEGSNTVFARARDAAGNYSAVKFINLTYEQPRPVITIVAEQSLAVEDTSDELTFRLSRSITGGAIGVSVEFSGTAQSSGAPPGGPDADYGATAGDGFFIGSSGLVQFGDGVASVLLRVIPNADSTDEDNETVTLTVSDGPTYTAGTQNTATGTIIDDDSGDDHGNSIEEATLIYHGNSIAAEIETGGDSDYFRIDLTEPSLILAYTSSALDSYGWLYDASGERLARNDDGGEGANMRMTKADLPPGSYYIAVAGLNSQVSGSYFLTVKILPQSKAAIETMVIQPQTNRPRITFQKQSGWIYELSKSGDGKAWSPLQMFSASESGSQSIDAPENPSEVLTQLYRLDIVEGQTF